MASNKRSILNRRGVSKAAKEWVCPEEPNIENVTHRSESGCFCHNGKHHRHCDFFGRVPWAQQTVWRIPNDKD